ncbi:MAG: Mu transposase C-terminal domain-containing protein [Sphingomonas sp.]|nr:Mu transposase C-terminal domain-containing protein [Sphingomonas sp.]
MTAAGAPEWLSSAEIAELRLPGLPSTAGKVHALALKHGWGARVDQSGAPLVRRREGQGGGFEYHVSLLPADARTELGLRYSSVSPPDVAPEPPSRNDIWNSYDRQSAKVKAEAERRAAILDQVEALARASLTKSRAVAEVSASAGVAERTIWDWCKLVEGVDRADWLPALAPRRGGGRPPVEVDPDMWSMFLRDYLAEERPSFAACYRRVAKHAKSLGLEFPPEPVLRRKLKREVSRNLIKLKREGREALRRTIPPFQRSVAGLRALDIVNIDGHTVDVRVLHPSGKIVRPILIAIQDVYSRKVLAWRLALTENMTTARLVFADLFRDWGIPGQVTADNGRAFQSKWLTGGTKTRFRFKVKDDEPLGLLVSLGIKIVATRPYRGSSKPIERVFGIGGVSDDIARGPACAGAYTGKAPHEKPENYGERAIAWADFEKIVDRGIAEFNARTGRRTEIANGRSFDEAFAESYCVDEIRQASSAELRKALLAAEQVRTHKEDGTIALNRNRYWCEHASAGFAGERVTVRFDPDAPDAPIHVYTLDDNFIATVPIYARRAFDDKEAPAERAAMEGRRLKQARAEARALGLGNRQQLAEIYGEEVPEGGWPEPKVIRPVRARGGALRKAAAEPSEAGKAGDFMVKFLEGVSRLPE